MLLHLAALGVLFQAHKINGRKPDDQWCDVIARTELWGGLPPTKYRCVIDLAGVNTHIKRTA